MLSHMKVYQEEFLHGHFFLQMMMKIKEYIYVFDLKMLYMMKYYLNN